MPCKISSTLSLQVMAEIADNPNAKPIDPRIIDVSIFCTKFMFSLPVSVIDFDCRTYVFVYNDN